jgi:phosphatidylglycerophosphate synthase
VDFSHVIYKRYSKPIIRFLVKCHISPNQITLFNMFFTIIYAGVLFARGTYSDNILALGVCFVNVLLDYIDGDLAKSAGKVTPLGVWLDTGGDILVQVCIMGAIMYAVKSPLWLLILYFISRNASSYTSFLYNSVFGFDSYKGSELFRTYMDSKKTLLNRVLKNIIDPTASWIGILLFTVRYWIIIGALTGRMDITLFVVTFTTTIQWMVLFVLYGFHLAEYKGLLVLQALAVMDSEREEYYKCRRIQ